MNFKKMFHLLHLSTVEEWMALIHLYIITVDERHATFIVAIYWKKSEGKSAAKAKEDLCLVLWYCKPQVHSIQARDEKKCTCSEKTGVAKRNGGRKREKRLLCDVVMSTRSPRISLIGDTFCKVHFQEIAEKKCWLELLTVRFLFSPQDRKKKALPLQRVKAIQFRCLRCVLSFFWELQC
jgi:hypothetical protein